MCARAHTHTYSDVYMLLMGPKLSQSKRFNRKVTMACEEEEGKKKDGFETR